MVDKNKLNYALSNSDIMDKMENQCNIIQYGDLVNYDNIDQVFGPFNFVFILFCMEKNNGHWTVLIRLDDKNIEFFDGYGSDDVDSELSYIPMAYRKISNQVHKTLSNLLKDSHYIIHYNDHQMQQLKRGINTCGRHCLVRCFNNHYGIDEYFKAIQYNSKKEKCSMDELVCRKTKF